MLLAASQKQALLRKQNKECRDRMQNLRKETKKAARQARTLKAKAAKTQVGELMQMLMMKAFILVDEKRESGLLGAAAASSTEPWKPANPKEAFDVIHATLTETEAVAVANFAEGLRVGLTTTEEQTDI